MKRSFLILSLLAAAACNSGSKPANLDAVCGAPAASPQDVAAVENGNAAFAVGLYGAAGTGSKNSVLSPYSVSNALDLAYAGAGTTTAAQMSQVLGLGSASANAGPAVAQVACQAETNGSSDGNLLSVAYGAFGQASFTFLPSFTGTLKTDYGAPLQTVDFQTDATAAIGTINGWVSQATNAMIPTLLQPGDVDGDTRLVLVNALYFKGSWQNGFDTSATQSGTFTRADGTQVSAPLMKQSSMQNTFGFFQGSTFAIAELPYKGGKLALDIVLPKDPSGLQALTSGLSAAQLQGWLGQLGQTTMSLTVPRFKIDTHAALSQPLMTLGLTLPFDPKQADFSGMDGAHDLYVQAVIHEATIEVDETGTVAAAATAVSVGTAAIEEPAVTFTADHPFLFVLRDIGTGTFLFVGQVVDPTQ